MSEFIERNSLHTALVAFGVIQQQRDDAIARIHRAHEELRAASNNFGSVECKYVAASSAVTVEYAKFYPDWDETSQSAWIGS